MLTAMSSLLIFMPRVRRGLGSQKNQLIGKHDGLQ
jgi:hypothetical protein